MGFGVLHIVGKSGSESEDGYTMGTSGVVVIKWRVTDEEVVIQIFIND